MLKQRLADLKDFILRYNTYFDNGFSNAQQDDETGIIHNGSPLFPSDTFGNYFYFRFTNQLAPDYSLPISDNHNSVNIRADVFVIASVREADPDLLVGNLLTTIGRYQNVNTRFGQILYHSEDVLLQELAKVKDKDNIEAALQRLPRNTAIVSVRVQISFPYVFQNLNCITKPCATC